MAVMWIGLLVLLTVQMSTYAQSLDSQERIHSMYIERRCGSERLMCNGANSECHNNQRCRCKEGFVGKPQLGCFSKDYLTCHVLSDPKVHGYTQQSPKGIEVDLPCQVKATSVYTDPIAGGGSEGIFCTMDVHFAEERLHGNLFVSAFVAEVALQNRNNNRNGRVFFLVQASADHEWYTYTLKTKLTRNGAWGQIADGMDHLSYVVGGSNGFGLIGASNAAHLKVEKCGLEIYFRPADIKFKSVLQQTFMPGLSIGLDKTVANYHVYDAIDNGVCLPPAEGEIGPNEMSNYAQELQMSVDEAMLYKAISTLETLHTDIPGLEHDLCTSTSQTIKGCGSTQDTKYAMFMCAFALTKKPFVNCYSEEKDAKDLLKVFSDCLKTFCPNHHVKESCETFESEIARCKNKAPPIDESINCAALAALEGVGNP